MFKVIRPTTAIESAYEMPFGYQTVPVHILRQRIQRYIRFEATHTHPHRCPTIQMQFVREIVYATMLAGITLFEGAWRSTSIRIQRASYKGILPVFFF